LIAVGLVDMVLAIELTRRRPGASRGDVGLSAPEGDSLARSKEDIDGAGTLATH